MTLPETKSKQEEASAQKDKPTGIESLEKKKKADVAMPTSTPTQPVEYAEDWQSEKRDMAIAQNGPTGEHYEDL